MPSSRGLPSLATVVDRFRVIPPRKRDCLKEDLFSDLEFETASLFALGLLPRLLILKKFLSLCGKWGEPLVCLDAVDKPEKFRFSEGMFEEFDDPNNCVMLLEYFSQSSRLSGRIRRQEYKELRESKL